MTAKKVDRRVRRTRELLREALLSLTLEKGYERVTVQDLIDRADVGRSTFYAHFRDKEELLLSGFDELREELARAFDEHERRTGRGAAGSWPALAVIEHVAQYRPVVLMLGSRGSDVALRRLNQVLTDRVAEHLRRSAPSEGTLVPLEVVVEFAVRSLLGLVDWWLDHGRPFPPDELAGMYRRLTEPGIRAGLRART